MNKLRKLLAIILALQLILGGVAPVLAEETSLPPSETSGEGAQVVDSGDPQDEPDQPDEKVSHGSGRNDPENPGNPLGSGRNESEIQDQTTSTQPENQGVSSNGQSDDTYITTGDATSEGTILNDANLNVSQGSAGCCGGNVGVVNDGNAANSTNTGSANVSSGNTTNQNNSANINNGLTGASVTGQNSASDNMGDSYIDSGNANTTGTIITAANTNVDGVAVSEFNIVDDHVGDYILDFEGSCISGCDGYSALAKNSNNGSNSDNDAAINSDTNNTTNQTNNGEVNNDLTLTADSGNNKTSGNTGGDSYITTGTAEVAGNVLTFLNNNLSGNIIYGVVNIFGDLIGDIILPESALSAFACATCGQDTYLANTGNGSNSDNSVSSDQTVNNTYNQINSADINNNLILDATTGGNSASGNTGGDVYIKTGNVNVLAQVLNVANTNIIGGDMWLVIINRAGQWIGQIMGAPQGSLFAGSQGTEFSVNENGEITAVNSGNGANSTNDASVNSTTNNTTNQTNNGGVNNNIHLNANTGKNQANDNTGGDNYITTGDAKILANLVNFVNNNIAGGRLLVTFVNVFGNWTGNFFTPDNPKTTSETLAQGSANQDNSSSQNNQGNNRENNNPNITNVPNNSNSSTNNLLVAAVGFFAGSSNIPNVSNLEENNGNSEGNTDIKVAGVNNKDLLSNLMAGSSKDKKMRINLAWAILLTPLLAAVIFVRKLYTRIKSAHRV